MHSSTLTLAFASAVAAQSTVTVFNLFQPEKTLYLRGSDQTATTYANVCPSSAIGIPASTGAAQSNSPGTSSAAEPSDVVMQPLTALPTGRAAIRRQVEEPLFCEPFTLIQGPETWQFHMTDPSPGVWTVDANCAWKGDIKTAEMTCTAAQLGSFPQTQGTTTTILKPSDVSELKALQEATVVAGAAEPTANPTPSSNGTGGSGAPTSAGPTLAESSGLAGTLPLPTGAMALVGGAAGIFAAALAL